MALRPAWIVYRPAHLHMLTLGFVAMMIFGVGYHVIPRMAGHPLISRKLPLLHWWASNAGLALMASGFVLRPHAAGVAAVVLAVGAVLSVLGAYTFAYLIWRTLDGPDAVRRMVQRDRERRRLAVLELVPSGPKADSPPRAEMQHDRHRLTRRRGRNRDAEDLAR
jgi:cbb3-type cytochrome oxidase subunit 1